MIGNVSFRLTEKRKQEIYDSGTRAWDVNRTYGSTAITRFSTMAAARRSFPISDGIQSRDHYSFGSRVQRAALRENYKWKSLQRTHTHTHARVNIISKFLGEFN